MPALRPPLRMRRAGRKINIPAFLMNSIQSRFYDRSATLFVIWIGFIFSTLSYWEGLVGSEIRIYITVTAYAFLGLAMLVKIPNILNVAFQIPFFKTYIFCFIVGTLVLPANVSEFSSDWYCLLVSLIPLSLGLSSYYSPRMLERLFKLLSIVSAIVAVIVIKNRVGGVVITTEFLVSEKNSLAVVWALSALGLLFYVIRNPFRLINILWCGVYSILFVCIVTSRARAALLALFLTSAVLVIKKLGSFNVQKAIGLFFGTGIMIIVYLLFSGGFENVFQLIEESITMGRNVDDLDSLSSGRVAVYSLAVREFFDSPFMGALSTGLTLPWVHNYPLRLLAEFGIFGSLPYMVPYVFMCVITLKGIFFKSTFEPVANWELGFHMSALILIISMLEPTYPFGPGTVTGIAMFMLGLSIICRRREMMGLVNPYI